MLVLISEKIGNQAEEKIIQGSAESLPEEMQQHTDMGISGP